ncbi:MAG: DUF6788 family protein [Acidobacteriota bacterium]
MTPKTPEQLRREILDRIAGIQRRIRQVDLLCSGTLVKRMKICGKPTCRCAHDPADRHGPYYEWGYMKDGRQVHRMIPPEQAPLLRRAITNYRKVRRLLRRWEAESVRLMQVEKRHK